MNKVLAIIGVWIAAALTVIAVGGATRVVGAKTMASGPQFNTPFQAVLLDNGQVYYGKITGLGTPYPKMTDVYYIVNTENPKTKQVRHVLVKRGKELHAPTETFLDARHIIMIEDVGTNSEVARLIAQSASQGSSPSDVTGPSPASKH